MSRREHGALGIPEGATDEAMRIVRAELRAAAATLPDEGLPVPQLEGKLLRPLVAWAFVPGHAREQLDRRFWFGALAIEMVHEASLLHDDIIDEAHMRRGRPTLNARSGVGPALVQGDHYLTAAYAVALKTESTDFVARFIRAVERTVAGEIRQGEVARKRSDAREHLEALSGKSGELFGLATALGSIVSGDVVVDRRVRIGRTIGTLYQQIDDLLDYCTDTGTGKPPLQDYRQKKWTWLLEEARILDLDVTESHILEAVFGRPEGAASVADRALQTLARTRDELVGQVTPLDADASLLRTILQGWLSAAEQAVEAQERPHTSAVTPYAPSAEAIVFETAWRAGQPEDWHEYFTRHARTFSLAARLFPRAPARQIEGLYAWCRITDDLVDDPIVPAPPDVLQERLDLWRTLSRAAWDGHRTGIPVLQTVMAEAAASSVDWRYPQALLHAVGLDIIHRPFADWPDLERYTFGVAGAVGGWMTQLFGVHDAETLDRAHAMGHALQLTNIIRDVGEDLTRSRIYLPVALMEAHGFSGVDLDAWRASGERPPANYAAAIEEVMGVAEAWHSYARPGLARLPAPVRLPIAAAAEAYRGIEDEVRRNGYDNLTRRAHTRVGRKVILGGRGIAAAIRPRANAAPSGGRLIGNIIPRA